MINTAAIHNVHLAAHLDARGVYGRIVKPLPEKSEQLVRFLRQPPSLAPLSTSPDLPPFSLPNTSSLLLHPLLSVSFRQRAHCVKFAIRVVADVLKSPHPCICTSTKPADVNIERYSSGVTQPSTQLPQEEESEESSAAVSSDCPLSPATTA